MQKSVECCCGEKTRIARNPFDALYTTSRMVTACPRFGSDRCPGVPPPRDVCGYAMWVQ